MQIIYDVFSATERVKTVPINSIIHCVIMK